MRIERIGENKIRIFVSYDDLEERDIDLDAFNYNSPETQELFWDLMEQAELELGFEAQESQLCIEAVSDVEHGFVITITRVDEENDFESFHKFIKNRYRTGTLFQRGSRLPFILQCLFTRLMILMNCASCAPPSNPCSKAVAG